MVCEVCLGRRLIRLQAWGIDYWLPCTHCAQSGLEDGDPAGDLEQVPVPSPQEQASC